MRKNTIKTIMVALVLLVVSLYFITGTYARYYEEFTGDTKANIAKWAVALKDKDDAAVAIKDLKFVVQSNTNVVEKKLAPNVTLKGTVKIDLTGTEVAAQYKAVVDKSAIADFFGASKDDISVTVSGATEGEFVDANGFSTSSGYTGDTAVQTVDIVIAWTNNDQHNSSDTTVGKTAGSVTLPVTLTVQQKI